MSAKWALVSYLSEWPGVAAGERGRCPHCWHTVCFLSVGNDVPDFLKVYDTPRDDTYPDPPKVVVFCRCPACDQIVIQLGQEEAEDLDSRYPYPGVRFQKKRMHDLWPQTEHRPVPDEVPKPIAADYLEASKILRLSPKSSAALSRRCLQAMLTDQGYTQHNLVQQIQAAMPSLPKHLQRIDQVREFGNFAAHAAQDRATGEIIDVEPEAAEWMLTLLERCFVHFYVDPAEAAEHDKLLASMKARKSS